MAHLLVASLAILALGTVVSVVMILQTEHPRLRRVGIAGLVAILAIASLLVGTT